MFIKHDDKICDITGGVLTLIKPKAKKDSDDSVESPTSDNSPCVLAFIKGKTTERLKTYNSRADGRHVIDAISKAIEDGVKVFTLE